MSCRCRDIRNCNRDLSVLNSVISRMGNIYSSCQDLQRVQEGIQNWEQEAFELDPDVRQLTYQMRMRNEENMQESSLENQRKVEQMVSRLESELSRMEREDDRYHDDDD